MIFCHCGNIEKRSFAALQKFAPQAELVDTSTTIYDYNEAIASRWNGESDLVVIEADKEITADVISSFSSCDSYWCSYSYFVYPKLFEREVEIGLGCVRYSAKLQQLIQPEDFMHADNEILFGTVCEICKGAGCWKFLDARIADAIRGYGINVHCHGQIRHHHDYGGILCQDAIDFVTTQIAMSRINTKNHDLYPNDELAGPYWEK